MTSQESVNCRKLRDAFEDREAIYVEKGVLRVRVQNIRCDVHARRIDAEVEEIPTRGLENTLLHGRRPNESSPLRWDIAAGYLTTFSDTTWEMGYGGWSLFFAPEIVSGLLDLASAWPPELDAADRYDDALRFLEDRPVRDRSVRVFSDEA